MFPTFFIFGRHLESIILYYVGQFKMKKIVFPAGETICFFPRREKSLDMLVDLRNLMPKRLRSIFSQLCHKHLGSSSKMEGTCDGSNMPPLEASRRLPTIFAGSSMGFVFLGKSDWLPFCQAFWYVQA
jgi:hypothetical protein